MNFISVRVFAFVNCILKRECAHSTKQSLSLIKEQSNEEKKIICKRDLRWGDSLVCTANPLDFDFEFFTGTLWIKAHNESERFSAKGQIEMLLELNRIICQERNALGEHRKRKKKQNSSQSYEDEKSGQRAGAYSFFALSLSLVFCSILNKNKSQSRWPFLWLWLWLFFWFASSSLVDV